MSLFSNAAIVGAGMSGLTAAQALREAGFRVSLFDKARGPGGRITTRRRGMDRFDHGAQFFRARSDEFRETVESWAKDGAVAPWRGRFATLRDGKYVRSDRDETLWVGQPRMSALGRYLAEGTDLHLSTRITQLTRQHDKWLLRDSSGVEHGPYDVLILTCPGPQAAALLPPDCPSIAHTHHLHYEPCWAVMLGFEQPIDLPWDGISIENGALRWAARDSSKPGRTPGERWTLLASPPWTREHLETDNEEVVRSLAHELGQLCTLQPFDGAAHRWLFSRSKNDGSRPPAHFDSSWNLGLCGDGFAGPDIEDAWHSGCQLAELLLAAS